MKVHSLILECLTVSEVSHICNLLLPCVMKDLTKRLSISLNFSQDNIESHSELLSFVE